MTWRRVAPGWVRPVGRLVALLFVLSLLTFSLLDLAPGDPAFALATAGGRPPDPVVIGALRQQLHLDDPVLVRYVRWLGDVVRGDFSRSTSTGLPVREMLTESLGRTLLLTGSALVLSLFAAVVLGSWAGLRPRGWAAKLVTGLSTVSFSVPTFVMALGALFLFAVRWRIFPAGGIADPGEKQNVASTLRHLLLPASTLALGSSFGVLVRIVSTQVREHDDGELGRMATARGLRPRTILVRHLLRLSLLPVLAQIGTSFGGLVTGAYAVEVVFSWPGLGRTAVEAAQAQDYPVVMGVLLVSGVIVIAGSALVDAALRVADPRVKQASLAVSR